MSFGGSMYQVSSALARSRRELVAADPGWRTLKVATEMPRDRSALISRLMKVCDGLGYSETRYPMCIPNLSKPIGSKNFFSPKSKRLRGTAAVGDDESICSPHPDRAFPNRRST